VVVPDHEARDLPHQESPVALVVVELVAGFKLGSGGYRGRPVGIDDVPDVDEEGEVLLPTVPGPEFRSYYLITTGLRTWH
jgi:hypothetical protein